MSTQTIKPEAAKQADSYLPLTPEEAEAIRQATDKLIEIMRTKRHTLFVARWDSEKKRYRFYTASPV